MNEWMNEWLNECLNPAFTYVKNYLSCSACFVMVRVVEELWQKWYWYFQNFKSLVSKWKQIKRDFLCLCRIYFWSQRKSYWVCTVCFDFLYKFYLKHILRRIKRGVIINSRRCWCKILIILVGFQWNLYFYTHFRKTLKYQIL